MIIKKLINFVIYFLIKIKIFELPKKSLRVLMFHNISDYDNFKKQINLIKDTWKIINPSDFYNMVDGKKRIDGRYLLLTFDDGFKSNLIIANKVLKKFNLSAIFFVPLKFILTKNRLEKLNFIKKNLKIKSIDKKMDSLNSKDLRKLKKLNFTIGAHTYSHINLKDISNKKKIEYEVIGSANKLEKILNSKIINFSFTFGRLKDISINSLLLSKKRFKYVFTGIRGENLDNQKIIFRDNVVPTDKVYDLYAYLSGYLDFIYSKERKIIKKNYRKSF